MFMSSRDEMSHCCMVNEFLMELYVAMLFCMLLLFNSVLHLFALFCLWLLLLHCICCL